MPSEGLAACPWPKKEQAQASKLSRSPTPNAQPVVKHLRGSMLHCCDPFRRSDARRLLRRELGPVCRRWKNFEAL